jgi:tetratricopeptide (TPR) repeat protein
VETAVALDPTEARPYQWRGRLRLASGDRAGATADLDKVVQLEPDRARSWAARAVFLHFAVEDDAAARADLDRAISLARNPVPYIVHRAAIDGVLPELGEVQKGEEAVKRFFTGAVDFDTFLARERSPDWRCSAHYYRALTAEVAGDRKAAIAHYRAALATHDNWSTAYGMAEAKLARLGGRRQATAPSKR